jgi:hypothetical protein
MKNNVISNEMSKVFPVAFFAFLMMNCSTNVKSEKELFEKNVSTCAQVFIKQGMDSVQATNYCSCMLEKLIKNDSGFVYMKEEERTKYIIEMKEITAECDSILID